MAICDWIIVSSILICILAMTQYARRYTKGVADFLSANRCAGRYLLVGAEAISFISAVFLIARFEQTYQGGFPIFWWERIMLLASWLVALTGWVAYRFRETRALTMAQFLEMRYGRKFRIFAGMLTCVSGLVNYGVFPAITSRLLIYFFGLPVSLTYGGVDFPTYPIAMFLMLSCALFMTFHGGQIAVMITDFIQSQFAMFAALIVVGFFLYQFKWEDIISTLKAAPQGQSMLDPYNQKDIPDFNLNFFLMNTFMWFYQYMAWQGYQGYFSSAKTPHEAQMARILAIGRGASIALLFMVLPIIAYVVLNSPAYASDSVAVQSMMGEINEKYIGTQMRVPLVMRQILPAGLMGLLAGIFLAAAISTDTTMLHSWGSIFIQDVILPLSKKPISPARHLQLLRLSVLGVAVFAFFFGLVFPVRDFILMYWAVTTAIFTGGAGAVIIGGLYWRRGTTMAAWASIICGGILAASGLIINTFWAKMPAFIRFSPECPLNGLHIAVISAMTSIVLYIVVSLCDKKPLFDLDKMLNRGKYDKGEHIQAPVKKLSLLKKMTGISFSSEFTRADKYVTVLMTLYTFFWIITFFVGNFIAIHQSLSEDQWAAWWEFVIWFTLIWAVVTTIWFFIGGMRDLFSLFRTLKTSLTDESDNGQVGR